MTTWQDDARQVLVEIDNEVPDSDAAYDQATINVRVGRRLEQFHRAANILERALRESDEAKAPGPTFAAEVFSSYSSEIDEWSDKPTTEDAEVPAAPSDMPIVCPGCYAVGNEMCASWCSELEHERELEASEREGTEDDP